MAPTKPQSPRVSSYFGAEGTTNVPGKAGGPCPQGHSSLSHRCPYPGRPGGPNFFCMAPKGAGEPCAPISLRHSLIFSWVATRVTKGQLKQQTSAPTALEGPSRFSQLPVSLAVAAWSGSCFHGHMRCPLCLFLLFCLSKYSGLGLADIISVLSPPCLTNCSCKDPSSKEGPILRIQVDVDLRGENWSPPYRLLRPALCLVLLKLSAENSWLWWVRAG